MINSLFIPNINYICISLHPYLFWCNLLHLIDHESIIRCNYIYISISTIVFINSIINKQFFQIPYNILLNHLIYNVLLFSFFLLSSFLNHSKSSSNNILFFLILPIFAFFFLLSFVFIIGPNTSIYLTSVSRFPLS